MPYNLPQVIEHSNQRILTSKQIADAYGTTVQIITNNFNRHKDRYTEGKHYYALEGAEKKAFLDLNSKDLGSKNAKTLYLWTKKGALMHAKTLGTDEAWEAYERLIDEYYRIIDTLQQLPTEIHKFTNMLADRAMKNLARVPDGFFAVLPHLFYQLQTLEQLTGNLDEDAKLEISVGRRWRQHAIENLHLSEFQMVQYSHVLANGRTVNAWAYSDIKSGDFYKWLWTVYFPENFPQYVEYRKGKLALPAPKNKQIKGK